MKLYLMAIWAIASMSCCSSKNDAPDVTGDVGRVFSDPGVKALAQAAAEGDTEQINRLLKNEIAINSSGALGITPLWWALRNRNKVGFEHLLAHGANVAPDVDAPTVLELASGYDDPSFLVALLKCKPDLNRIGRHSGATALHVAMIHARTRNVELLISSGFDLNKEQGAYGLPLIDAGELGRYDYVYMMLENGANPEMRGGGGVFSLAKTIQGRHIDPNSELYKWRDKVIELLQKKGIRTQKPKGN